MVRKGWSKSYDSSFLLKLNLMFHETKNVSQIRTNYPTHGTNALDLFATVKEIEALYEEFVSRGAAIHYELKTNEYQMREFAVIDPQGYTIGFGESLV